MVHVNGTCKRFNKYFYKKKIFEGIEWKRPAISQNNNDEYVTNFERNFKNSICCNRKTSRTTALINQLAQHSKGEPAYLLQPPAAIHS